MKTKLCKKCESEFHSKDYRTTFCSRSCASLWNRKPLKESKCIKCGNILKLGWTSKTTCSDCKIPEFEGWTLERLKATYSVNEYHSKIRQRARFNYRRSNQLMECKVCQYQLHVEIAHIKDIKDFSPDTLVKEVNLLANLIALCPNHHWEFDHNLLSQEK